MAYTLNYYFVKAIEELEKMPDSNEKENVQKCLLTLIHLLGLTPDQK